MADDEDDDYQDGNGDEGGGGSVADDDDDEDYTPPSRGGSDDDDDDDDSDDEDASEGAIPDRGGGDEEFTAGETLRGGDLPDDLTDTEHDDLVEFTARETVSDDDLPEKLEGEEELKHPPKVDPEGHFTAGELHTDEEMKAALAALEAETDDDAALKKAEQIAAAREGEGPRQPEGPEDERGLGERLVAEAGELASKIGDAFSKEFGGSAEAADASKDEALKKAQAIADELKGGATTTDEKTTKADYDPNDPFGVKDKLAKEREPTAVAPENVPLPRDRPQEAGPSRQKDDLLDYVDKGGRAREVAAMREAQAAREKEMNPDKPEQAEKGFSTLPTIGKSIARAVGSGFGIATEVPKAIGEIQGGLTGVKPEETTAYKIGQGWENQLARSFPLTKEEENSIIARTAHGITDVVGLLVGPGEIGFGAKATMAGITTVMGASGAAHMGEAAGLAGATPGERLAAATAGGVTGAALGASQGFVAAVLKPVEMASPALASRLYSMAAEAIKEGGSFAGLDAAQQWVNHEIAKATFDPKSEFHLDARSLTASALTGGAMGGFRGGTQRYTADQSADSENLKTSGGAAQEQAKPNTGPANADIGNQRNQPNQRDSGNDGSYSKGRAGRDRALAEGETKVEVLDEDRPVDKTVAAALAGDKELPAAVKPAEGGVASAPAEPTIQAAAAPRETPSAVQPDVTPQPGGAPPTAEPQRQAALSPEQTSLMSPEAQRAMAARGAPEAVREPAPAPAAPAPAEAARPPEGAVRPPEAAPRTSEPSPAYPHHPDTQRVLEQAGLHPDQISRMSPQEAFDALQMIRDRSQPDQMAALHAAAEGGPGSKGEAALERANPQRAAEQAEVIKPTEKLTPAEARPEGGKPPEKETVSPPAEPVGARAGPKGRRILEDLTQKREDTGRDMVSESELAAERRAEHAAANRELIEKTTGESKKELAEARERLGEKVEEPKKAEAEKAKPEKSVADQLREAREENARLKAESEAPEKAEGAKLREVKDRIESKKADEDVFAKMKKMEPDTAPAKKAPERERDSSGEAQRKAVQTRTKEDVKADVDKYTGEKTAKPARTNLKETAKRVRHEGAANKFTKDTLGERGDKPFTRKDFNPENAEHRAELKAKAEAALKRADEDARTHFNLVPRRGESDADLSNRRIGQTFVKELRAVAEVDRRKPLTGKEAAERARQFVTRETMLRDALRGNHEGHVDVLKDRRQVGDALFEKGKVKSDFAEAEKPETKKPERSEAEKRIERANEREAEKALEDIKVDPERAADLERRLQENETRDPNWRRDKERDLGDWAKARQEAIEVPFTDKPHEFVTFNGEHNVRGQALKTERLRDALTANDVSRVPSPFKAFMNDIYRRLVLPHGDVPVHTVTRAEFDRMYPTAQETHAAAYDPVHHVITIADNVSGAVRARILMHEGIHAATTRAYHDGNSAHIDRLFAEMQAARPDLLGHYGMKNAREFLAEAFTKESFQRELAQTPITDSLADHLGMPEWRRATADMWQGFVRSVQKMFGIGEKQYSALEATLRSAEHMTDQGISPEFRKMLEPYQRAAPVEPREPTMSERAGKIGLDDAAIKRMDDKDIEKLFKQLGIDKGGLLDFASTRDKEGFLKQTRTPWTHKAWPTPFITAHAKNYLGKEYGKALDDVASHLERARTFVDEMRKGDFERLHDHAKVLDAVSPAQRSEFESLNFDVSRFRVWPDLPITQQGFRPQPNMRAMQEAIHPELERRYNALTPELKRVFNETHDMISERQKLLGDRTGQEQLQYLLPTLDPQKVPGLIERIRDDKLTAQDELDVPHDTLEVVRENLAAMDYKSPYLPHQREGEHVVTGTYHTPDPVGTRGQDWTTVPDKDRPTYRFTQRDDAKAYAASNVTDPNKPRLPSTVSSAKYEDSTTGKTFHTIKEPIVDDKGNPVLDKNGVQKTRDKDVSYIKDDMLNDPNIRPVWDVEVQDKYMSQHRAYRDAVAVEKELADSKLMSRTDVQPKQWHPDTSPAALASHLGWRGEKALNSNDSFRSLSKTQQDGIRDAMAQQYIQMIGSTRNANARVHRSDVAGESHDFLRAIDGFSQRTSNTLGHMEVEGPITRTIEKAEKIVNSDQGQSAPRRALLDEMKKRVDAWKDHKHDINAAWWGPSMHRLMMTSYTARLATTGFGIRNSMQPITHTMPFLWANYGARGIREMGTLLRDIGAARTLGRGVVETARAFKGEPSTIVSDLMGRLKDPNDKKALQHAIDTGTISADNALQIEHLNRPFGGSKFDIGSRPNKLIDAAERVATLSDKALEHLENVSKGMMGAVELNNRALTYLAVSRLEMKRNGGDFEAAQVKAREVTDMTQVRYTPTSRPPVLNHPLARIPLQFKQFGMYQYGLMGSSLGRMLNKASTPQERMIGAKTIAGYLVAHMAFAGILGLPTEPARMAMIAANYLGITKTTWDDVERNVRKFATNMTGSKVAGEALSMGLPRLIGIDMNGGMGIQNTLLFGSPRAGGEKDYDRNLQSWLFQTLGGAPGAWAVQVMHGIRDLANGKIAEGMQNIVPVKQISDAIRAYREHEEGRKTDRGRETSKPSNWLETAERALGLPPSRYSERSAFQHAANVEKQQDQDRRSSLIKDWLTAKPGPDKEAARKAASEGGVKSDDLHKAANRMKSEQKRSVEGVVTTKRSKGNTRDLIDIYNLD